MGERIHVVADPPGGRGAFPWRARCGRMVHPGNVFVTLASAEAMCPKGREVCKVCRLSWMAEVRRRFPD